MLNLWRGVLVLTVAWLAISGQIARSDQLELTDGRRWEGAFSGVMTRGKVSFSQYDNPEVWQGSAAEIARLTLDVALPGTLVRARSPRQKSVAQVIGYKRGSLILRLAGEQQTMMVPLSQILSLSVVMDMQAYMRESQRRREQRAQRNRIDEIETLLIAGQAAIVHFCTAEIEANSRQAALARTLCERSHGQALYIEFLVDGIESVTARKYALRSLPQFWFYDSRGKLRQQLSDRFTEADMENALRQAMQ